MYRLSLFRCRIDVYLAAYYLNGSGESGAVNIGSDLGCACALAYDLANEYTASGGDELEKIYG